MFIYISYYNFYYTTQGGFMIFFRFLTLLEIHLYSILYIDLSAAVSRYTVSYMHVRFSFIKPFRMIMIERREKTPYVAAAADVRQ